MDVAFLCTYPAIGVLRHSSGSPLITALLTEILPSTKYPSAKIFCPSLTHTASPTTRSSLLIVLTSPFRITSQYLTDVLARNSMADFRTPSPVLTAIPVTIPITIRIINGSDGSITPKIPRTSCNIAIAIKSKVSHSLRASLAKSYHFLTGGSGSLLLP